MPANYLISLMQRPAVDYTHRFKISMSMAFSLITIISTEAQPAFFSVGTQEKKIKTSYYKTDSLLLNEQTNTSKNGDVKVYVLSDRQNDAWYEQLNKFAIVAWILSTIGLFYTIRAFQRATRYKRMDFILEVDKMLIANPMLWGIYDTYKNNYEKIVMIEGPVISMSAQTISITNENALPLECLIQGKSTISVSSGKVSFMGAAAIQEEDKLRAFCYYKINNFEMICLEGNANSDSYGSWEMYMIEILTNSTFFRNLVQDITTRHLYSQKFTKQLALFLTVVNELKAPLPKGVSYDTHVKKLLRRKRPVVTRS